MNPDINAFDFLSHLPAQMQMPLVSPLPPSHAEKPDRGNAGDQPTVKPISMCLIFLHALALGAKRKLPLDVLSPKSDTKRLNSGDTVEGISQLSEQMRTLKGRVGETLPRRDVVML